MTTYKNITLSAEAHLIELARKKASEEHRSLNLLFRRWLAGYVQQGSAREGYKNLMKKLRHVSAGGPFSRDELNER